MPATDSHAERGPSRADRRREAHQWRRPASPRVHHHDNHRWHALRLELERRGVGPGWTADTAWMDTGDLREHGLPADMGTRPRPERDELLAAALLDLYATDPDERATAVRIYGGRTPTAAEMPLLRAVRRHAPNDGCCRACIAAHRRAAAAADAMAESLEPDDTHDHAGRLDDAPPWAPARPPTEPHHRLRRLTFTRSVLTAAPPARNAGQGRPAAVLVAA